MNMQNGEYLDATIFLGTDSSYSASQDDNVFLERKEDDALLGDKDDRLEGVVGAAGADGLTEFVIELQVQYMNPILLLTCYARFVC